MDSWKVWNACTQDPHWWVRQIECHPSMVMAVQAVALFGAIIAAIVGPLFVAYYERKRRAAVIGGFVAADYFAFRMSVELLANRIREGGFKESSPTRAYDRMLEELRLQMPASFNEALRMATEADLKKLSPCTRMINTAVMYNRYVEQFLLSQALTAEWWPATLEALAASLEDVRNACSRAWPFFAASPDPVPAILARSEQKK